MGKSSLSDESVLPKIVASLMVALALATLWAPWITAGGVDERESRNAFWKWPIGAFIALLTLGAALAILFSGLRKGYRRWPIITMGGLAITPGLLLIGGVEFAQSLVPTSLTPVLTNSDFLTLRAEVGVWSHVGLVIGGLTISSISDSMTQGSELINPTRAIGRVLLVLSVIAIPIVRALPLFSVEVASRAVAEGNRNLAVVEIVPGEVPGLGVVSTVAVLAFAGLSITAIIRPQHLILVGASFFLGLHLAVIWLQVTVAALANTVLPDNWESLIGNWAALEIETLHTSTATLLVSMVGFGAILILTYGQAQVASLRISSVNAPASASTPLSATMPLADEDLP